MKNEHVIFWIVVAAVIYYFYKKNKPVGDTSLPITKQDNTLPANTALRGDLVTGMNYLDGVNAIGTSFSNTPVIKPTGTDPVITDAIAPVAVNMNPSVNLMPILVPTVAQISAAGALAQQAASMTNAAGSRLLTTDLLQTGTQLVYTDHFADGTTRTRVQNIGVA